MTTTLIPYDGNTITDAGGAASGRDVEYTNWPAGFETGYVIVSNQTDGPVCLRTANTAALAGRVVGSGSLFAFGPYPRGTALWVYGVGTGSVYIGFDVVASEGR